jgi:Fe-S oxidoreductase
VRTFAELVRDGYTVVCSEPTAALALKEEYPRLLDTDDAKLVAANTIELTALLAELQAKGELKPPTRELPLGIGHHVPCHLKALGPASAPSLLAIIPKLSVHAIDVGCSGSAGAWGFARVNHENSLKIGEPLFAEMDRPRIALGATECSTCRMQIQQGTGKRVLHPVQFLALAYGLVPQLEARLTRPLKPLLTG